MLRLSDHLYRFSDTCHVYILRNGDSAVLIDFGAGDVLDALPSIGVTGVTDVLMTHHHRDQGQGLVRAVERGARVWVPETEQDLFARVEAHWQGRPVYNHYNVRQDRFSLLSPVPVAGTLRDYETRAFGGSLFRVTPTPGHTTGSISLLAEIDGRRIAFTGDLIAAPGKVWSLAATQWNYKGGEGLPYTVLSALDLQGLEPDVLLPSHGEPIPGAAHALELLVERLHALMRLRGQNPRLSSLAAQPYAQIIPHLLLNRTSLANSYVLLSDSGKALFIDFGYDFMAGLAAGEDRASRRPWLYTLPALKREFGVTCIDVAIPTHYHDDHVAGFNLLRRVEGTRVWASETFSCVLQHPATYDLPCLWYDPIPVDRRLPVGIPFQWEEYEITLHHLPGHTRYAAAVALQVDGLRVLATGDQHQGENGSQLNYLYQNRFEPGDYRVTAALYRRLDPHLILPGHGEVKWVNSEYLHEVAIQGEALEQLHRSLQPDLPGMSGDGFVARIAPYQAQARAGEPAAFVAEVTNPFGETAQVAVEVVAPPAWMVSRQDFTGAAQGGDGSEGLPLAPLETRSFHFSVTPPAGQCGSRARISVDVTIAGWRFGQQAEALVDVAFATPQVQRNRQG